MTRVEWPPYRSEWLLVCDCLDEDGHRFRVRENCSDCATDRATAHRQLGHHPTLQPPNRGS